MQKNEKLQYQDYVYKLSKREAPRLSDASPDIAENLLAKINKSLAFRKYVARGGQGIIVKGWDKNLLRNVAVKIALNQYNAPGFRRVDVYENDFKEEERNKFRTRFVRGASVQAQLASWLRSNVYGYVPWVFDSLESPCWLIQEWFDAPRSLGWAKVSKPDDIIIFGYRLIKLLQAIHSYQIIHRDIKPDNKCSEFSTDRIASGDILPS